MLLNYNVGEYDHDGDPDTATLTGDLHVPRSQCLLDHH